MSTTWPAFPENGEENCDFLEATLDVDLKEFLDEPPNVSNKVEEHTEENRKTNLILQSRKT